MRSRAAFAAALAVALAVAALRAADAPKADAPGVPPVNILNPDVHVRLAAQFVSTRDITKAFPEDALPYLWFISLYRSPDALLESHQRLLRWWLNQMSFNAALSYPREVPGSFGRLFWVDIRDFNWNWQARQAVGERDLYFAEPWIDHENAELLRRMLHAPLSDAARKGRLLPAPGGRQETAEILPAISVVDGCQLLRDALETDRTPTYYDLLFARQRFGETRKEKRTRTVHKVWKGGRDAKGHEFPAGYQYDDEEEYEVETAGEFVDFPRDEDDWNDVFGVTQVRKFALDRHIDLDFGAVVDGGGDNPNQGSIVARNNRLLATTYGPFGATMETYDVSETIGVRDFSEMLIFGGKGYTPGRGVQAVRDAGELLAYLPNGGQAGLLVNAQNKRIEAADNKVAKDTTEPAAGLESRVRNYGSCVVCHSPAGGYIVPRDVIKAGLEDGIAAKSRDHDEDLRIKAFFKGYEKRIKGAQDPYLDVLAEATRLPKRRPDRGWTGLAVYKGWTGTQDNGWTGAQLAAAVKDFRAWYDAPLDAAAAAADMGTPEQEAKRVFAKSPFNRPNQLLQGEKIPRRTWETDVYPNCQVLRQALVNEGDAWKPKN